MTKHNQKLSANTAFHRGPRAPCRWCASHRCRGPGACVDYHSMVLAGRANPRIASLRLSGPLVPGTANLVSWRAFIESGIVAARGKQIVGIGGRESRRIASGATQLSFGACYERQVAIRESEPVSAVKFVRANLGENILDTPRAGCDDWFLPSFCSGIVLMLETYIDESDTYFARDPQRQPILVLAGYLADYADWRAFSAAWSDVLREYQLPYFHARKLRSGNAKLYRHLTLQQRCELVRKLAALISAHVLMGVATYIRPCDYRAATTRRFREKHGSAYGLLTDVILGRVSSTLLNTPEHRETISVFIEDGHKNCIEAVEKIKAYKDATEPVEWPDGVEPAVGTYKDPLRTEFSRIGGFGLVSKSNSKPIHAADLLAYLIGMAARLESDSGMFDGVLDSILTKKPHLLVPWGPTAVPELIRVIEDADTQSADLRSQTYELKKYLRSFKLKVEELPWGITIDGRDLTDEEWQKFRAPREHDPPT